MATATMTWVAETGADWGYVSDGPYRVTAAELAPPYAGAGVGETLRGFLELRMASLAGDPYSPGDVISAAQLAFSVGNETGAEVRLVVHSSAALSDDDATLFGRIGPANTAWSDDTLINALGPKTIDLNATALAAIAAMGGSDSRVIGFALADESGYAEVLMDVTVNAVLTLTFTPSGGSSGPAHLKSICGVAKASVKTISGVALASVKSVNGVA